jgi:uncharacterized membrane protein
VVPAAKNWCAGHIDSIRPDAPLVVVPNMTVHAIPTLFMNDFGMCFRYSVRVTQTKVPAADRVFRQAVCRRGVKNRPLTIRDKKNEKFNSTQVPGRYDG